MTNDADRAQADALTQKFRATRATLRSFRARPKAERDLLPAEFVAEMATDAFAFRANIDAEAHAAEGFPALKNEIRASRAAIAMHLAECRRLGWSDPNGQG